MPRLSLFLLGSPRIELDGATIDIKRRKAIALLAYLAVTGQSHRRDTLAALLWPELDQSRARGALRRTLSALNTAIDGVCLAIERETVALRRQPDLWNDVDQFGRLAQDIRPDDSAAGKLDPERLARLVEAVALYRDDFLAGFTLRDAPDFDEWQFFQTESLRQTLAGALEQLVVAYTHRGDYEPALDYARRWSGLDPLHEPAHRRLMELYAQTDQRAAALRQYQVCVRALDEALGVPPAAETTTLYERIRSGQTDGDANEPEEERAIAAAGQVDHKPINGAQKKPVPSLTGLPAFIFPAHQPSDSSRPFVARERELAQLNRHLSATLAGGGRVVLISGEAGAGKTALAQAFARQAQEQQADLIVAGGEGNAYTGAGDPYLPFREILGLLTGEIESRWLRGAITRKNAQRLWNLLPFSIQTLIDLGPALIETFIPKATVMTWAKRFKLDPAGITRLERSGAHVTIAHEVANAVQNDLFEQYTNVLQALAKTRPLILMIDDVQWADAASINLLFHLSRRIRESRLLLVVTYRPDEVALGRGGERHPLAPVINEIKRIYGQVHIDLDQTMSQDFVEVFLDTEPNRLGSEFRAALYRQTQGHPLFTVELLREMQERGSIIYKEPDGWIEKAGLDWETLPARVEAVIEERIGRLDRELRDILAVASVEGEQFTAQVVGHVQGREERQLLGHLSQTLEKQHHLIREQCEVQVGHRFLSCYQFTHTLFQQYLYDALSAGERRLLHGEVALALEKLYHDRPEEITIRLAHHYAEAGQTEQAVDYLLRAGDKARNLHAYQEAIDFYNQALALLKEQQAAERAARTLMKLGLTHHLAFNFKQARRAYQEGFTLWQRANLHQSLPRRPAPHPLRMTWHTPPTLDCAKAADNVSGFLINQLFSGLVVLTPDMDVAPEIAQSWDILDGGRRYVFHLRDDVCWSDGVQVTAEDFIYAWRRVLDPALGSSNAGYLFDIKGARAFHQGQPSDPAQLAIHAPDPFTLVVEMEGPTGYFPQMLSLWPLFPLPRHIVEAHGDAWTETGHIVTNGAFHLKCWTPGQSITLKRNPDYRGRFSGNVEEIHLTLDVSETVRLEMYRTDNLDVIDLHDSFSMHSIRHRYAADYLSGPSLHTQYLCFNIERPPFDDQRVRQAFALAIDKETLASIKLAGAAFPATGGFIPPGMPEHSPEIGLPYDPDRARRLLAEAGYPAGRDFPPVTGLDKSRRRQLWTYLQAQWREILGVDVSWDILDWSDLLERLSHAPPHFFRMAWSADYPDPDNFLRLGVYFKDAAAWQNQAYIDLVERARRSTDQTERLKLYQEADKLLIEEAVITPLSYGQGHALIKPWVAKYPTSPLNWYFLKDVVIEPH